MLCFFFGKKDRIQIMIEIEKQIELAEEVLSGGTRSAEELMELLSWSEETVTTVLHVMGNEGRVFRTKKNKYALPETLGFLKGKFQGNQKGFGFFLPENGAQDIYIPADMTANALHGDTVLARLTNADKREGEIVRVLIHANDTLVGKFELDGEASYIVPDDSRISMDIYVPSDKRGGAQDGDKVFAHVFQWGRAGRNPQGEVTEILGKPGDPETDIQSILKSKRLRTKFPEEVLKFADKLPDEVTAEELTGRKDLRALNTFTIDGATAKDFDDAVSVERTQAGYLLGVHIADVSHYVTPGNPLDEEAYARATSVYLPDRVLPMLPEKLSNGLCSLNPNVDRLTLSCMIELNADGHTLGYSIVPAVIHSHARLVYEDVTSFLETGEGAFSPEVKRDLSIMAELAEKLGAIRYERGALDLNVPEANIKVNESGEPIEITRAEVGLANHIIEEFMLKANECVAEFTKSQELPILYRVHEEPDPEKMETFAEFVQGLGYRLKGVKGKIHPKSLQTIVEQAFGTKEETVISFQMLRSLQKARYTSQPLGHFGLAAKDYCHFTSPIRRYPDLFTHRVLHAYLDSEDLSKYTACVDEYATHTSEMERSAMEAERDADDYEKAWYMSRFVGKKFSGIISSVTSFGLFVQLENTVEGLIHISRLDDDFYQFIEKSCLLVGERSRKIYRLGDPIDIRVLSTSRATRRIDFAIDEKKR